MLFSVVIPTCKRQDTIQRAIESVLAQKLVDIEIIVVDDNPAPDTELIRFCSISEKISIVRNTDSHGVANARNTGIAAAKGEWVAFLDDDDEFLPGYLQSVKDYISTDFETSFYWCGVKVVSGDKNYKQKRSLIELYDPAQAIFIGASYGVVINKKVLSKLGGFNSDFRVAEDTELFARLLSNNVKGKPVKQIGILKHEAHEGRLSSSFLTYSTDQVYERIFQLHLPYFRKNKLNYMHLISWSSLIHAKHRNYNFALHNLKMLMSIGKFFRVIHLLIFLSLHYFGISPKIFMGYPIDLK